MIQLITKQGLLLVVLAVLVASHEWDSSTFSNLDEVKHTSLALNLLLNFDTHVISGSVEISFQTLKPTPQIILDVRDLTIYQVQDLLSGNNLSFVVKQDVDSNIGGSLTISLLRKFQIGETIKIVIYYKSLKDAVTSRFVDPSLTLNKDQPMYFSMNEPTNVRSIVPCQDSPYYKIPITATISTNKPNLTILFGGKKIWDKVDEKNNKRTAYYEQKISIPTYLIAIAVGNFQSKPILIDKVNVWAESTILDKAVYEFENIKKFITQAQIYMGFDYEWGVYDILVLPPTFNYGGMENPNLTFVTSEIVKGDRSQENVLAHELSHSWTGNLVTNQNWDNFWMNEGFTTFLERKLLQLSQDTKEAGDALRQTESKKRFIGLQKTIEYFMNEVPPKDFPDRYKLYTHLDPKIGSSDPTDYISLVPYEKGYNLLYWLESQIGEDNFKLIIRAHVIEFKYGTANYDKFKTLILIPQVEKIFEGDPEKKNQILKNISQYWDIWINGDALDNIPVNDFSKDNIK